MTLNGVLKVNVRCEAGWLYKGNCVQDKSKPRKR